MPRAYAEVRPDGLPIDRNVQAAIDGFLALNHEISTFTREDIFEDKFWRVAEKNPFVGSIKTMTRHFTNLEKLPDALDYPAPLQPYLRREVKEIALEEALLGTEPVFIKPVETKLFDSAVYDGNPARRSYFSDYIPCSVWSSQLLANIKAEWRCYVHHDQLVHASCYSGDFKRVVPWLEVEAMVGAWPFAPVAYTLDIALSAETEPALIEANDFWAISSYSLDSVVYAQMLSDRYFEIISSD